MRRILFPTVVLIAALSLTGCSAGSMYSSADLAPGAVAPAQDSAGSAGGAKDAGGVVADREVVTSGTVTIKTKDPIAAGDQAAHIVEAAGGRVDARTETAATRSKGGRATLDLRIPAAVLTPTLDKLKKLGAVQTTDLSAEDVTQQGQDLDARIKALATSVDRLLALEAKASDTKVLIDLETAISDRQGQLDSLSAQRRYLSDQVAMSTVQLSLVSPADVPVATPANPGDAFGAGIAGFGAFFTGLFLVLSYLLPWIVLLGAIAIGIVYLVRRRRRRRPAPVPPTVGAPTA